MRTLWLAFLVPVTLATVFPLGCEPVRQRSPGGNRQVIQEPLPPAPPDVTPDIDIERRADKTRTDRDRRDDGDAAAVDRSRQADKPRPDGYFLCFWNVENFFDDEDNHRKGPGDRVYDSWFAEHPDILRLKLDHLSEALVRLNDGKGPDIIALVEVESVRAADLLRRALNDRLKDPSLQYPTVLMRELTAGRHIAPAVITRLPAHKDRTRLHGNRMRILETHLEVDRHELVLLVSHWTSRLRKETEHQREHYGNVIYGTFKAMYRSNPHVDLLVCGDFNDTPRNDSVTDHLHAVGDLAAVRNSGEEPLLLNLFAGKDPQKFGTEYDRGRWQIFDQICVSPGLLDDVGWSCDVDSAGTVNQLVRPRDPKHRPWRFGGPHDKFDRGYSDHFPVTVRLRVH
jgi:endonuclease/exonuclease/phosphatase family metal-dependent hydrolase